MLIQKNIIKKGKDHAFSKDVYLLGSDSHGINYWLEAAKWECDWYWGFGYVETYQRNVKPSRAKDIDSHQHINSSFIGKIDDSGEYIANIFYCPTLSSTTFTEAEGWKLTELFKTFYILKETAQMFLHGGAGFSSNPLRTLLENKTEVDRINKIILPALFAEIYKILEP